MCSANVRTPWAIIDDDAGRGDSSQSVRSVSKSLRWISSSDDASPVRWKGPMDVSPVWLGLMEMNVIREFLADVVWGELDYLLADLPPGAAADKPPVIAGFIPDLAGAIVVTTPSEVASDVVQKSVTYARDMGIKVLGIVENMSEYRCPSCGEAERAVRRQHRRHVRSTRSSAARADSLRSKTRPHV